jgi:hypothetical protein
MRRVLLVGLIAFAVDAYVFSGAYTQATVREITAQVQKLASNSDVPSEQPTPPRPIPDQG